ncbi:undecaprenyl-phosphate glucose phosphotransferase [Moritella sp. 24]|uniref:undecaprenyl-phosphate glucose phosphotransferase n=1 Tax=Moritella sp. 24 TaxID=2746230 RepID=UPI001BA87AC6|nr:undecaprenyl-phosphate glucose phosphotransferase [Moritella sp. 24]QUM75745.1 undecaprenyl-phosphate glucose phosphotransferase [Moritella sp. 24]
MRNMWSRDKKNRYFAEQHTHKRLYRYHQTLLAHGQLFSSIASSSLIMIGAAYWLQESNVESYKTLAIINCLIIYIIYQLFGVYHQCNGILLGRRRNFLFGLWVLSKAWFMVILSMVFFTYLIKASTEFEITVFITWSISGFFAQAGLYGFVYFGSKKYQSYFRKPIISVIIGANDLGKQLITKLHSNTWLTEKVVGVVEDSSGATVSWDSSSPIVGKISEIREIVQHYNIKRVYITLLLSESNKIEDIISLLDNECVDIIWVPDILSITTIDKSIRELSGLPLLVLSGSPMRNVKAVLFKSLMDRILAFTLLILLLPLFIVTAVAIKLTSPGAVFFKQKRHGWDGRNIEIWKFRSMYTPKADNKFELVKRNDQRVTTVGMFIRKTSIDELPQLFNVLQGNMSLVGPRPHAVEVNQFYRQHIPDFMLRHRIKPGITGLAQICGFRGGDDCTIRTLDIMEKRAAYDIEYINHWSLLLDLKILLLTPFKIFSHDAY